MNTEKPLRKAQLHIHTRDDIFDGKYISYSAEEFIDLAGSHQYHFIAITNHEQTFNQQKLHNLSKRAEKNNIVLIPGVEKKINGKDLLIYFNYEPDPHSFISRLRTLKDIMYCKEQDLIKLLIVPHPYFHLHSMGNRMDLIRNHIDAIEHSWFYTTPHPWIPHWLENFLFNMNRPGQIYAHTHNIPLIASGDLHSLDWFDKDFTLLRCDHSLEGFFNLFKKLRSDITIRQHSTQYISLHSQPLDPSIFSSEVGRIIKNIMIHMITHPHHLFH
ncbi:MAG: hypothetical protein GF384_02495 [Elusimicrobia bacterium]|nr:hypothetical protein [Elusimicrobiota bacterium]